MILKLCRVFIKNVSMSLFRFFDFNEKRNLTSFQLILWLSVMWRKIALLVLHLFISAIYFFNITFFIPAFLTTWGLLLLLIAIFQQLGWWERRDFSETFASLLFLIIFLIFIYNSVEVSLISLYHKMLKVEFKIIKNFFYINW